MENSISAPRLHENRPLARLSLGPRLADKKSYEGHFPGPLHPLEWTVLSQAWTGHFTASLGNPASPRHPCPGPGAGSWAGTVDFLPNLAAGRHSLPISPLHAEVMLTARGLHQGRRGLSPQPPAGSFLRWMGSGLVPGHGPPLPGRVCSVCSP